MNRRTFIGGILAFGAGVLAKVPWGKADRSTGPFIQTNPKSRQTLESYPVGKFGHWICLRDRGTHSRILVDGKEVAACEANDIEGWAIIDIDLGNSPKSTLPAVQRNGKSHFSGLVGRAKVHGDVQVLPGRSQVGSIDWDHQLGLLHKRDSRYQARDDNAPWIDYERGYGCVIIAEADKYPRIFLPPANWPMSHLEFISCESKPIGDGPAYNMAKFNFQWKAV